MLAIASRFCNLPMLCSIGCSNNFHMSRHTAERKCWCMYLRRPFVLLQGVVSNPSSASYLDFDWSGNKTEKRSSRRHSNPSGVLKKLARPDMLIFAGGATCLVGEDKVGLTC